MMGAARIGERELLALGREAGWEALAAFAQEYFDYSESRMIAALQALPSGTASHESTHDPIPGTPEEGIRIRVGVPVDSAAARVSVDLRDNPDTMACGPNLSPACARTAARVAVSHALDHTVPTTAGGFRRP